MKEKKLRYYVIFFLLFVYFVLMFIFFLYPNYKDKHNKTSLIVNKSARWYYEDGKWKDMTDTNQYNWQAFDIYQDGTFLGNYYLLYNDKWYIFDKNRDPIKQDGVDIFAIKTNQKYQYGNFTLEDTMEAGNRCFDQRVPEEVNRRIVDHISDINLTYSSIAREYLISEGLPADQIIKTGSPMFEVLERNKEGINNSDVLERLELEKNKYFVVSAHREENINNLENFKQLTDSLNAVAEKYGYPIIMSTHPRTRKMLEEQNIVLNPLIQTLKPLGFNDYIALQKDAKATLSDSGTISEESSILKFAALNLREAHERPEAFEEAAVMMVGVNKERILQGLQILESQGEDTLRYVADYSMPNVSQKVLRIIVSYTDYVNRVIWKKY